MPRAANAMAGKGDAARATRPLQIALDYANAQPTERNWRAVVLGKLRAQVVGRGGKLPEAPFGVASLEECQKSLAAFREILAAVVAQRDVRSIRAMDLARTLHARAGLILKNRGWDPRTKLLMPRWDTKKSSFDEMLYAQLVLALEEVPYDRIHRCERCERFFFHESARRVRYCSSRCRNQALVQRYRERHPARHRAYHRELMRRRRAEGKE